MIFHLALVLLSVFVYAESDHDDSIEQKWQSYKAQKPAKESLMPLELVEKIKSDFFDGNEIEKKFLPAEIFLFDSHGLISPPVKVITPIGGGTVNFSELLPEGKAKFSLRVKLVNSEEVAVVPSKVYFVPHLSLEREGKEVNCGKFFDVTSFFKSHVMTEAGYETYLTNGIYAGLFVGAFFFVHHDEEKKIVSFSNVNFVDDRYLERSCLK